MRLAPTLLLPATLALALAVPAAFAQSPSKQMPAKSVTGSAPAAAAPDRPAAGDAGPGVNGSVSVPPELRAAIALEQRAIAAMGAGRVDEAAVLVTQLAREHPGLMRAAMPALVRGAVDDATPGSAARIGLLQALVDIGYVSPTDGERSAYAYELALERLLQGDADAAAAAVAQVESPETMVKVLADQRFDAIVAADAARFDIPRAARREVDRLRAAAFLDQDVLGLQVGLGAALITAGDFEDALALADEVEATFAAAGNPGWRDPDQRFAMQLVRWHALLALRRAGDVESELAARVAARDTGGGPLTALLLAGLRCALADYPGSATALAPVPASENIVGMLREAIRVCAASQSGDAAGTREALAWLRAHREIDRGLYTEALVQAGELDAAAADVIARLRDPRDRSEMLFDLQHFRDLPTLRGEFTLIENWDRVRARADVRAAIAEVGRLGDWPVYKP